MSTAQETPTPEARITVRPYNPPSFLTSGGAAAKMYQLEKRGLRPSLVRDWRFITLTFDRKEYPNDEEAYELGKRHLRQFMHELSKRYKIARHLWKLEFQGVDKEGRIYPHWHLLVDYKRKMDLEFVRKAWGKGRVEVQRAKGRTIDYLLKYIEKAVDTLPEWLLLRHNVRFMQTSKGFFDVEKSSANDTPTKSAMPSPRHVVEDPDDETKNEVSRKRETIGERIKRWGRSVVSRTLSGGKRGVYYKFQIHENFAGSWGALLVAVARDSFSRNREPKEIEINTQKIETSCLLSLPIRTSLMGAM